MTVPVGAAAVATSGAAGELVAVFVLAVEAAVEAVTASATVSAIAMPSAVSEQEWSKPAFLTPTLVSLPWPLAIPFSSFLTQRSRCLVAVLDVFPRQYRWAVAAHHQPLSLRKDTAVSCPRKSDRQALCL